MSSSPSSTRPSRPLPKSLPAIFLFLSFAGFADAAYLTVAHYANLIVPCSLTNGCEKVLTSVYATAGPIPIALLGAAYYLALFILGVLYFDSGKENVLRFAANLTWVGLLTSLFLLYLQIFVLHAICLYCTVSAAVSIALFAVGMTVRRRTAPLKPSAEKPV